MKKRKRVIIITDSISMPRPGLSYEKTWPFMMKQAYPHYDFIERSARGSTTRRLATEGGGGVDLLETYSPDTVIIQLGTADCAPRLFSKTGFEYRLLQKIPFEKIRKKYIDRVKKKRGRNPNITEIGIEEFSSNLAGFFGRAKKIGTSVIMFLLINPNSLFIKKSPHIGKNIDRYNHLIKKTAGLFPNVKIMAPFDPGYDIDSITVDELHINEMGNKIIFNKLKPLLR
ncbi:MAG: SGNH/GDSL hydrolase family protein [Spirochaetes bacterium]|nr:SGNH/GDSL hydrolase family protein [Spirochaetota bacterium]